MHTRHGFTLIEVLVVIAIIAVLTAILFPVFHTAREKGRQATCITNQRQLALLLNQYASDHDGVFPAPEGIWQEIEPPAKLLHCPTAGRSVANAYVINNIIPGKAVTNFPMPQETALTFDGAHQAASMPETFDGIAYSWRDLRKRHSGKALASFLDGHVEVTDQVSLMLNPPQWPDVEIWYLADNGVNLGAGSGVDLWLDHASYKLHATPLNKVHRPEYVESVPSLGGASALLFRPPNNNPNILVTDPVEHLWTKQEATMFIVYQPTGNSDHYEYTVLDQMNGAEDQATRYVWKTSGSQNAPALFGVNPMPFGAPNPTVSLSASATSVTPGTQVTLTWSSSFADAVVSSNFGATSVSGSKVVTVTATTTFTITVSGGGKTKTATVTVTVTQPAPSITLSANPTSITEGDSATLNWSSTNVTSVVSSNFGAGGVNGTTTVSPTVTTTYTITVSGPGGQATATQTITVTPAAISVNISANPTTINSGDSATLTWSSCGATQVDNNGTNFTASGVNGSTTISPTVTTTYTIKVKKASKSASDSVVVTVIPKKPTVTLTASPVSIKKGDSVTLSWSSTDATSATSNYGGSTVSGSQKLSPSTTTTYTITVIGPGGDATATVTVTVDDDAGPHDFAGKVNWFRNSPTMQYPPDGLPWNTPILLTVVSSANQYVAYNNGVPWPAYSGGPDWKTPDRFYIGGSTHGTNANRRTFDGYIAEVLIYRRALSDAERQAIELYLRRKYGFN